MEVSPHLMAHSMLTPDAVPFRREPALRVLEYQPVLCVVPVTEHISLVLSHIRLLPISAQGVIELLENVLSLVLLVIS
jgi:hypothetical protein